MLGLLTGAGLFRYYRFLDPPAKRSKPVAPAQIRLPLPKGSPIPTAGTLMVHTPYGVVDVRRGWIGGVPVLIVARERADSSWPPHRVRHQANLWTLRVLGATKILATTGAAATAETTKVGSILVPEQLVDFSGKAWSFRGLEEGPGEGIVPRSAELGPDLRAPFCPRMRRELGETGGALALPVSVGGTVASRPGPGSETAGELGIFGKLGVAASTICVGPEARLARELGMCYQPILLVVRGLLGGTIAFRQESLEAVERLKDGVVHLLESVLPYVDRDVADTSCCITPPAPASRGTEPQEQNLQAAPRAAP